MNIQGNQYRNNAVSAIKVTKKDGSLVDFDHGRIRATLQRASQEFSNTINIDVLEAEVMRNIYQGVTTQDVEKALVLAAVSYIERDPIYSKVAARILMQRAYKEVFGVSLTEAERVTHYKKAFIDGIKKGIELDVLDARMKDFDLEYLSEKIDAKRDSLLEYLGIQTLYDRYFLKTNGVKYELPQTFWMRVAMGLSLHEENKEERALEFYELFSNLRYVSSTPTLFHSGYKISQLSSCYLSTVHDDLGHIFKCIGDNAQLSKWAGGIGNDWTNIRSTGATIKSIHATSQGVIPFLKLANDVVTAITRSGIRRGGTCAYLESWHLDVEDFLDLRRNTGDERRRTHDMNTANWIPDLFMKRVLNDQEWTLFSPHDTPDLHSLYGSAFEARYIEYEKQIEAGKITQYKKIEAKKLWRKMLSRLFETGHPWITFKDPCNVRSPQDHAGVVHSSNLCTEITLNTSEDETAVCNLGSINLSRHIKDGSVDEVLLAKTIKSAIRMLDNVIDLNYYPTKEAKNSNQRHRPIGLGMMGFQDALFKLDIPFGDETALEFADTVGEIISYYAILASSELAKERGTYGSYKGSKWDRNIFPLDTVDLLEKERGVEIDCSRTSKMNWQPVRDHVKKWGMRNSNVMSIAPTATIANIAGCYPSIEPIYKNIYVKANVAGEFTIINNYLVQDLKKIGLWNDEIREQLKYYDGDVSFIPQIPEYLKLKYKTAFELDPVWLLKITAVRGKWIDQSQSHNVFMKGVSGKKLEEIYQSAWKFGLKTTYYLRTLGASQIEKSTLDAKKFGYTQKREYKQFAQSGIQAAQACSIEDPSCESCQ